MHFALVKPIDSRIAEVIDVQAVDNADAMISDPGNPNQMIESVEKGRAHIVFCLGWNPENTIQASYNGNVHRTFPGHGYIFDREMEAFYSPSEWEEQNASD